MLTVLYGAMEELLIIVINVQKKSKNNSKHWAANELLFSTEHTVHT